MALEYNPALEPCPICGAAAVVVHVYDSYDRADYGYDCGCPRFRLYDGIHNLDENSPRLLFPRVCGCLTKQDAITAWNEKVKRTKENHNGNHQHNSEEK